MRERERERERVREIYVYIYIYIYIYFNILGELPGGSKGPIMGHLSIGRLMYDTGATSLWLHPSTYSTIQSAIETLVSRRIFLPRSHGCESLLNMYY